MECRSCGAQLPPEAKECPACGAPVSRVQQLPAHRRKRLTGLIAGLIAIVAIAGLLLWYFIATDRDTNSAVKEAICDMRFSDAEATMEDVHLFQPGDLELRKALIAAGKEAEQKDYVALLQRITAIREGYDTTALAPYRGVIDQLEANAEPDLYITLCADYDSGAYSDVLDGFETLAERSYERSKDYLFLTHAHLAEDLATLAEATGMTASDAEQRLLGLIGFADANKLIFSNDSYCAPYLEGVWESGDGSIAVHGSSITCSLPGTEDGTPCAIHNGALYLASDPDTPIYTLEVFNLNTLICDRVVDGINCTLRKQA